ncbi:MAG: hypothetical protein V4605_02950 [Pseudomonadota bacterium]
MNQDNKQQLSKAVEAALAGDWQTAHEIAQEYSDTTANWLHAVLHKIEGDKFNSNYWYAKTHGKSYEDFSDAQQELIAIRNSLR